MSSSSFGVLELFDYTMKSWKTHCENQDMNNEITYAYPSEELRSFVRYLLKKYQKILVNYSISIELLDNTFGDGIEIIFRKKDNNSILMTFYDETNEWYDLDISDITIISLEDNIQFMEYRNKFDYLKFETFLKKHFPAV